MQFSKTQIAIAAGAGVLVLLGFFFYLMWLNGQPPVLAKSPEVDPLTKVPVSIKLNPLRDRTSEHSANEFLRALRDGHCDEQLADWEKDYRKRYAAFICDSEAKHPLVSWRIVDWEDRPPLRILHYSGKRRNEGPGYDELLSVTLDDRSGEWVVTKYDSLY
jgi:hypothetical protein